MRFAAPAFLLLLTIVVAWVLAPAVRPRLVTGVWRRAWLALPLALLVLAIAGLQISLGTRSRAVAFVVDASDSMASERAALDGRLEALQRHMRPGDQASLVVFGGDASVEHAPRPAPISAARVESRLNPAASNLEAALRLARITLPPLSDRRLVLLSDGAQTSGDAMREAMRASLAQIPVDVAPPLEPRSGSLDIRQISAPIAAAIDEPFLVSATIGGPPGGTARLLLTGHGASSQEHTITLPPTGGSGVAFSVRAAEPGLHAYELHVRAVGPTGFDDRAPSAGVVVAVTDAARVLYVSTSSRLLERALTRHGFRVDTTTPESFARSASRLAPYGAVVIDAVDERQLDARQHAALREFVEQHGGGVLILGTSDSLQAVVPDHGLGALLPVDVRPRAGERTSEVALVVAFDKSGSMDDQVDGVPRIEFARQAVARVLDVMHPSDALGVIAFDGAAHEVVPLAKAHDLRALREQLQKVVPGGPTALMPALERAAQWLRRDAARGRRHLLLVTDGRTSAADAERASAFVAQAGFEVSVVALSAGGDRRFLERLAASTGGRAYFADAIRDLPAIVARESARVSGGRMFEGRFVPQARAHPALTGIDTRTLPPIDGYVVTALRASAEPLLVSALNDPLLAGWQVGLGRSAVYTADLGAAWSANLRTWPHSERLFAQTVRWLSRRTQDPRLYARFTAEGDVMRMVVEAQDSGGTPLASLSCAATVRTPAGDLRQVVLTATEPGRYEGTLDHLAPGSYAVSITAGGPDRMTEARLVRGFYWNASAEHRTRGVATGVLAQIAETTGGRMLGDAESVFDGPRDADYVDASPWFAGVALFVFVAEILLPRGAARVPGARPGWTVRRAA